MSVRHRLSIALVAVLAGSAGVFEAAFAQKSASQSKAKAFQYASKGDGLVKAGVKTEVLVTTKTVPVKENLGAFTIEINVPEELSNKQRQHQQSDSLTFDSLTWSRPFSGASAKSAPLKRQTPDPPTLMVSVNDGVLGSMPANLTAIDWVNMQLSSYHRRFKNFTRTSTDQTVINGRRFGTSQWQGENDPGTPQTWYGITYVTMLGSKTIIIEARDLSKVSLQKSDFAAKTLKLH